MAVSSVAMISWMTDQQLSRRLVKRTAAEERALRNTTNHASEASAPEAGVRSIGNATQPIHAALNA